MVRHLVVDPIAGALIALPIFWGITGVLDFWSAVMIGGFDTVLSVIFLGIMYTD